MERMARRSQSNACSFGIQPVTGRMIDGKLTALSLFVIYDLFAHAVSNSKTENKNIWRIVLMIAPNKIIYIS